MKSDDPVSSVRNMIDGEVPIPENLGVIVAAALTWVHNWNRETAINGECNCNKCLGEIIDEIRGDDDIPT